MFFITTFWQKQRFISLKTMIGMALLLKSSFYVFLLIYTKHWLSFWTNCMVIIMQLVRCALEKESGSVAKLDIILFAKTIYFVGSTCCISTLYFIVHSHTDNVKHNCLLRNTRGISLGAVAVHSTKLVPNKPNAQILENSNSHWLQYIGRR